MSHGKTKAGTERKRPARKDEGRPTDYKPEYCEQVRKLCLLGATDKEIALYFGVTEATVNNWKTAYPEFIDSIKDGRENADNNVVNSLYKKATGYDYEEEVLVDVHGMNPKQETRNLKKHMPPSDTAIIYWLKNRQPEKWRDKKEVVFPDRIITGFEFEVTDNPEKP